jgi:hypothetical protein
MSWLSAVVIELGSDRFAEPRKLTVLLWRGALQAEHFHRLMLKGRELLVSPEHFIVHAHVGAASADYAPDGVQGNWGTGPTAESFSILSWLIASVYVESQSNGPS